MNFLGKNYWALILGGSSGFGLASAKKLASCGMNICLVHRDRRGAMERIEKEFAQIRGCGVKLEAFNVDALQAEEIKKTVATLSERCGGGKVRVLLHSIAFGSLKLVAPLKAPPGLPGVVAGYDDSSLLDDEEMGRTVYAMGTSLLSWTQAVFSAGLFAEDARVFGLTSEGNEIAWRGYAAVATEKSALEAVSRSIAKEFAVHGIRFNILQPGVTDTPALRLIPGNEKLKAHAAEKNPFGRLTVVEDVANVVALLAADEAAWINGSLIRVDGGERISG